MAEQSKSTGDLGDTAQGKKKKAMIQIDTIDQ